MRLFQSLWDSCITAISINFPNLSSNTFLLCSNKQCSWLHTSRSLRVVLYGVSLPGRTENKYLQLDNHCSLGWREVGLNISERFQFISLCYCLDQGNRDHLSPLDIDMTNMTCFSSPFAIPHNQFPQPAL